MAKLLLIGRVAEVELTVDDEGYAVASCYVHDTGPGNLPCDWTLRLDNMNEMVNTPMAEAHADRGTR